MKCPLLSAGYFSEKERTATGRIQCEGFGCAWWVDKEIEILATVEVKENTTACFNKKRIQGCALKILAERS